MKKVLSMVIVALLLVSVAACGTQAPPAASAAPSAAAPAPSAAAPVPNVAPAGPEIPSVIKIGVVSAVSGTYALEGKMVKYGVGLVEDMLKETGGVEWQGHKIPVEFIYEDGEAKPEVTLNVFRKLIDNDKVLAIVGPPMSGPLLSAGPVAQEAKVPTIGIMTTNVKVTQIGDYLFRCCFIDPFQAQVATKYLSEKGIKKVAILTDNTADYSTGLTANFKEAWLAAGGEIVEEQTYAGGSTVKDFNVQLSKIMAAKPEAVFAPTYFTEVPLYLQQARAMGLDCLFLGTDSWDTPEIIQYAGDALKNAQYISCFSAFNDDPICQAYVKAFRDKYNEEPNANATFSYDSCLLMLEAIKNAKTLDGPSVRDALAAIKGFKGATGTTTFGDTRDPVKSALIMEYTVDGKLAFVTRVDPS